MEKSMQAVLENALRDAADAHHSLILDMEKTGQDRREIESENANWHRFYACYVARRLQGTLTGIQGLPTREIIPIAHVRGSWDGGPSYQAEDATAYARSRYHVG